MRTKIAALALFMALFLVPAVSFCAEDTWINELQSATVVSAPFTRQVLAGELYRIKIQKGKVLRLSIGQNSGAGLIALVPMKDGHRSGPKELLNDQPVVFLQSLEEADEIAMRVFTGRFSLVADTWPMEEKLLKEGQRYETQIKNDREFTARIINASDYRSTCQYTLIKNGEETSQGSPSARTLTLEFRGSARQKTWKTQADTIRFDVLRGNILLKCGYPFENEQ